MRIHSLPVAVAASLILAGCSDGNGPGSGAPGTIAFGMVTTPSTTVSAGHGALSPALAATPLRFEDNAGNVLVMDEAQVVLKQVSFERADNGDACPEGEHDPDHHGDRLTMSGASVDGASLDEADQDEADDHDACDARALGPILVDLPLNSGPEQQFAIDIEPGTYTGVRFHIHKANSGAEAPFLASHPEFVGSSIRVTGTWNDTPFVFTTSLNALQRQRFDTPVTVEPSATADVTLLVDLSKWFLNGGALVDPSTALAGGANEHLVWENIKRSFHAFRDHNHDGRADD